MDTKSIRSKHKYFCFFIFQKSPFLIFIFLANLDIPSLNIVLEYLNGFCPLLHYYLRLKHFILFTHQILDVTQFLRWILKVINLGYWINFCLILILIIWDVLQIYVLTWVKIFSVHSHLITLLCPVLRFEVWLFVWLHFKLFKI